MRQRRRLETIARVVTVTPHPRGEYVVVGKKGKVPEHNSRRRLSTQTDRSLSDVSRFRALHRHGSPCPHLRPVEQAMVYSIGQVG